MDLLLIASFVQIPYKLNILSFTPIQGINLLPVLPVQDIIYYGILYGILKPGYKAWSMNHYTYISLYPI